jgi:hypothetical protein
MTHKLVLSDKYCTHETLLQLSSWIERQRNQIQTNFSRYNWPTVSFYIFPPEAVLSQFLKWRLKYKKLNACCGFMSLGLDCSAKGNSHGVWKETAKKNDSLQVVQIVWSELAAFLIMFFWVKSPCGLVGTSQRSEKRAFSILRTEVVSQDSEGLYTEDGLKSHRLVAFVREEAPGDER